MKFQPMSQMKKLSDLGDGEAIARAPWREQPMLPKKVTEPNFSKIKFFQNLKISNFHFYKSVGPPRAPPQARSLEMRSEVHAVLLFYHATFRLV